MTPGVRPFVDPPEGTLPRVDPPFAKDTDGWGGKDTGVSLTDLFSSITKVNYKPFLWAPVNKIETTVYKNPNFVSSVLSVTTRKTPMVSEDPRENEVSSEILF